VEVLGIDIGGTGIKGAVVEIGTGTMLTPRHRIPTPPLGRPDQMAEVVAQITEYFMWKGPVGIGFPAAVRGGMVVTASNISKRWLGINAVDVFSQATSCSVCVVNDADAAGLAEMSFGAGRNQKGVVIIVTIGTGLGTALFTEGVLLPNAELGHIEMDGEEAEARASDAARKREDLSWMKWGKRFNEYLTMLEHLFWPDLIILGGGTSKQYDKYSPAIQIQTEVVLAQFLNEAGIIGAAMAVRSCLPLAEKEVD